MLEVCSKGCKQVRVLWSLLCCVVYLERELKPPLYSFWGGPSYIEEEDEMRDRKILGPSGVNCHPSSSSFLGWSGPVVVPLLVPLSKCQQRTWAGMACPN